MTVEYRTLSIQLSRQTSRPLHGAKPTRKYNALLSRFKFLRRGYQQREDEHSEHEAKLGATADELSTLKFHLDTVDETLTKFSTSPIQGLETDAIKRCRERDGPNVLSSPPNRIWLKIFQWLFSGFCPLLWIAAIFVWISWKPLGKPANVQYLALGIAILLVIFLQAGFSAWQEWTTSRVMASITGMLPTETMVTRNGNKTSVAATELVQGDIVHVRGGDKIPADIRLIEVSRDLRFDRSMLTGESDPIVATVNHTDENYLETRNIAVMGTHVTQGSGTGVVIGTGDSTVMGRIAKMTASKKNEKTLLQIEITRFVLIVAALSLTIGTLLIVLWATWLRHSFPTFLSLSDALVNSAGVIVAFVPEGLPICLTLTLTLVAKRMQRQNVLVKNLTTVETLGSVNVICSDKTGTLTQNQMTVVHAGFIDTDVSTDDLKTRFDSGKDVAVQRLYDTAALCNGSSFDPASMDKPIADRRVNGDATDSSILRFAERLQPVATAQAKYTKLFEIPFNSKNKWMLSLRKLAGTPSAPVLLVKGAPDVLLQRCSSIQNASGDVLPLDKDSLERLQGLQRKWSGEGQRVLMLCRREFQSTNPFAGIEDDQAKLDEVVAAVNTDLTIVGLVGIVDPPRKEIPHVVDTCRRAGIRVFMVTGDFALTAAAIARQCKIITNDRVDSIDDIRAKALQHAPGALADAGVEKKTPLVLSGSELVGLQPEHWDIICHYTEIVFARTTPEQKLLIVQELRNRECYVAVTGDGVNDSPAMKAAHIGVAMGSGSEVAKEAADMVLLDNNFSSILVAIENGRLVFENLKKVVLYLMPAGSFSEFVPMFLNMVLGVPLPLSVIFMIVICMLTDVWASISLMYEAPESDIMYRKPRNPKRDHLVNLKFFIQAYGFIGILESLFAHVIFFIFMYWKGGFSPSQLFLAFDKWTLGEFPGKTAAELSELLNTGESVFFLSLVVLQWGNMFATRTRRLSVFQQNPFWGPTKNLRLLCAIPFTLGITFLFCYVPWFNNIFGTHQIPAPFFFIPMPFAIVILVLDEIRKLTIRTRPSGFLARIAW
ncbi:calcium ATPase transmembrane domain M-containing protein [Linderina pennispora]|uniref:Calcium ATPase transmembrane domain M-containing protein n=1 Tax=Linderina pennispora TaxID=61395 RepID=A0A1Y1WL33_9FUNG|nr:calcium ATPase transmembrane domain M-containing protein [Linderina pennispora]ORX74193.1 calcium ATPase transmembrane domain M-containing protein [Linderina pennispora]